MDHCKSGKFLLVEKESLSQVLQLRRDVYVIHEKIMHEPWISTNVKVFPHMDFMHSLFSRLEFSELKFSFEKVKGQKK